MRRLVASVAVAVLLAACGASSAVEVSGLATPTAVGELLAEGEVTVVDVRTPAEHAEGHIAGAVSIDFEAPDFEARVAELPRDAAYVLYCRSGRRSAGAAAVMARLGFERVTEVEGGIVAWEAAGLPVER